MAYEIRVEQVEPGTIASVRRRATIADLSKVVPAACGEVWDFVRASGIRRAGRHVAVYPGGEAEPFEVEVGVEVAGPFEGDGRVCPSATPAGTVAATVHTGPYHRLGEAHGAIQGWCRANHRRPAGPNWEIYGHWDDDPAKLRTDVYYLLDA